MHAHVAFSDFETTSPLTRHPSMSTFSFEMFLELGRSEGNAALVRTRRHANHRTVVGLRRDLIHEIEGATQLAGLRVQWSWWSYFLDARSHRAPKVFVRFVGIFKHFNAAPVADYHSVFTFCQVFTQVAFP